MLDEKEENRKHLEWLEREKFFYDNWESIRIRLNNGELKYMSDFTRKEKDFLGIDRPRFKPIPPERIIKYPFQL